MGEFRSGIDPHDALLMLQGAPETGDIPNGMRKPAVIEVKPQSLEYAPTGGTNVLGPTVS